MDNLIGIAEFVTDYCKDRDCYDQDTINEAFEAWERGKNVR